MATEYYLVHCCQLNSILYLVCLLFLRSLFVVFKSLIFNISSLLGFFAAHGSYAERLRYIYIYIYKAKLYSGDFAFVWHGNHLYGQCCLQVT